MGLMYFYGCVHEVLVRHHDRRWVPTPNVRWCKVRDALAHAVWPRGQVLRSHVLQRHPKATLIATKFSTRVSHDLQRLMHPERTCLGPTDDLNQATTVVFWATFFNRKRATYDRYLLLTRIVTL